jgi:hypothetical protein
MIQDLNWNACSLYWPHINSMLIWKLPWPQKPTVGQYNERDELGPFLHNALSDINFNIIFLCTLSSPKQSPRVLKRKCCMHFPWTPAWYYAPLVSCFSPKILYKPKYKATHYFYNEKNQKESFLTTVNMSFSSKVCKQREVKAIVLRNNKLKI